MMTGGDKITTRELYSLPITFKIDAKMIILCNYTFEMEDVCDDSMPRRINFIPFESRFKTEPNVKISYEKQRNDEYMTDNFINKIKGSFMKILLDRYYELSKNEYKYSIPKMIRDAKQEFIDENDFVKTFYNETYEYSENKNDFIQLKDMYDEYKRFCIFRKTKADKLKLFKNRVLIMTPNYKEQHEYIDEFKERKNIRSVVLGIKLRIINLE
jgi:phage/plasmid-associated DNA primase